LKHATLDFFYSLASRLTHARKGRKPIGKPSPPTTIAKQNNDNCQTKQQQLLNETAPIAKRNSTHCQTKQITLPQMRKTKSILRATLAGLCLLALTACTASKQTNNDIEQISYHEARNFFLNQGQELAVGQKITNDKDFDKYFGLAAFMGLFAGTRGAGM